MAGGQQGLCHDTRAMRVVFSCVAGSQQHLNCLLPLARAARDEGHDVLFASGADRAATVDAHGFRFAAAGLDFAGLIRRTSELFPEYRLGGPDEELVTYRDFFALVAGPPLADDLVDIIADFDADVVVHEAAEFGGPLAAARRDIPSVTHAWGLPIPPRIAIAAGAALAPMWTAEGLDPGLYGGMYRNGYIDVCPPSLTDPDSRAHCGSVRGLRPAAATGPVDPATAAWLAALPDRPVVHMTMGTAAFGGVLRVFRAVAAELAADDLTLVLTVGPDRDPAAVQPLPANAMAFSYVPHATLLPHCDVVINHGGTGSVFSALEHGVPVVVLPQGADQFRMADAVAGAGVGIAIGARGTAADVAAATRALLRDQSYRAAAKLVQSEIVSMPDASSVVAWLTTIARERL